MSGPAELERMPGYIGKLERLRVALGDVLDPDRLQAPRPGADDRRHRRVPREPDECRQRAAVAPEDEARPEDHVLDGGRRHGALHLPLGGEVRHPVLRLLAHAECARQHEAAHTRFLGSCDEVARALRHHALEVGASIL